MLLQNKNAVIYGAGGAIGGAAVVSLHTCAAAELEEVASGSGVRRIYEPLSNDRSSENQRVVERRALPRRSERGGKPGLGGRLGIDGSSW